MISNQVDCDGKSKLDKIAEQLEASKIPTRQASWNTKSVAVDPPDKCCETCEFYQIKGMEDCGNTQVPHIDFEASESDPAEFWCNHWQQKEEQK